MSEITADVLAEVRGRVGFITLNRPKAINALSLGMVRDLLAQLLAWKDDPQVLAVAIRGSQQGRRVWALLRRRRHPLSCTRRAARATLQLEDFFTEEYALNHLIFTYPKPYIAFMDGIVMGGGMGISQGAACAS